MNLLRLLLLGAAAYAIWRLLETSSRRAAPPTEAAQRDGEHHYEAMAPCVVCGTHLPARALSSHGRCGRCSQSQ